MTSTQGIHWQDGMLLDANLLKQNDSLRWRSWSQSMTLLQRYAWGIETITYHADRLSQGFIEVTNVDVLFKNFIRCNGSAVIDLSSTSSSHGMVYLQLHTAINKEENTIILAPELSIRPSENQPHIPLMRYTKSGFKIQRDEAFIPALLKIQADQRLMFQLQDLVECLASLNDRDAKELYAWLIFYTNNPTHPYAVFKAIHHYLYLNNIPTLINAYDHNNIQDCMSDMINTIKHHIRPVQKPTLYTMMKQGDYWLHVLDPDLEAHEHILLIKSHHDRSSILFKIAYMNQIDAITQHSLDGLPNQYIPNIKSGYYSYRIDLTNHLNPHNPSARQLALHINDELLTAEPMLWIR